ncbi:MAG: TIGR04219 family outer membrane beta-barrel protein [Campylobacterales bacterium]|nr:TIGR04219 family outer membrane beta-barrel protein [Campylobacterales bacterium]
MKKVLSGLACGILLASTANADFTRVEMGAGAWTQNSSGNLTYTSNGGTGNDKSLEKDNTSAYAWLLVKHPIPILPNLKLEYASIKNSGSATGSFKEFSVAGAANTTLDMKQFDIIPYYNILDNTAWTTLDIGLDAKVANVSYDATGNITINGVVNNSYSKSITLPIPLLYVRARVQVPATNIGFEADAKYIAYSSSSMYDVKAKVDYTLGFIPVLKPAIELGYRVQKIKIDEKATDATMDLTFAGAYAGLMLRF